MTNSGKLITVAVSAYALTVWGKLAPWLGVVLVTMLLDYLSGMAAAWLRGELSSRAGIRGLIKKVGYLVLIMVALITDWALLEGGSWIGFSYQTKGFVALLVILWLLINELISILENIGKIGVPYPNWLLKVLSHLKQTAEGEGDKLIHSEENKESDKRMG